MCTDQYFIEAYFNDFEKRIAFLEALNREGHGQEALLLCCCYIESFGNDYYGNRKRHQNFVKILGKFGNHSNIFNYVHLQQLGDFLKNTNEETLRLIYGKVAQIISSKLSLDQDKLYSESEVISLVGNLIDAKEVKILRENLWRSSYASIAYKGIRCKSVHEGFASNISFGNMTFMGNKIKRLDFGFLYEALKSIFVKMRDESLKAGCFFMNRKKNNTHS